MAQDTKALDINPEEFNPQEPRNDSHKFSSDYH